MLTPASRQAEISDYVARRGEVTVDALALRFGTSAETIRRDLGLLANAGLLRKVHGGAKATSSAQEGAFGARMRRNFSAKQMVAENLSTLVKPGMTLFMDTGSTTLICAQALARVRRLTVITNSTRIASALAGDSGDAEVYLLGGRYRGDNAQTVGVTALGEIDMYQADMAVLTIGALDEGGASDFSNHEAQVARAMVRASKSVALVADHSKFGQSAAFRVASLTEVTRLVIDRVPDGPLLSALRDADVEVVA